MWGNGPEIDVGKQTRDTVNVGKNGPEILQSVDVGKWTRDTADVERWNRDNVDVGKWNRDRRWVNGTEINVGKWNRDRCGEMEQRQMWRNEKEIHAEKRARDTVNVGKWNGWMQRVQFTEEKDNNR